MSCFCHVCFGETLLGWIIMVLGVCTDWNWSFSFRFVFLSLFFPSSWEFSAPSEASSYHPQNDEVALPTNKLSKIQYVKEQSNFRTNAELIKTKSPHQRCWLGALADGVCLVPGQLFASALIKTPGLRSWRSLMLCSKEMGGLKGWAHTDRHADGQVFTFLWLRWNVRTSCQCCIKGRSKNCPMGWKTGIIPQFSQIPSGQKKPIGLFLLFSFSSFDFTVVEPKPVWIILIGCLVQTGWFELWCFCLEQSILRRFHHSCVEWCHYQVMEKPLNRLEMIP